MVNVTKLPKIICLEDYGGNYTRYIDAVYDAFKHDFIYHQPAFGSHKLRLKYHPEFQSRAYTFYHMTHHGENENERTPDLRRCERIPWARPTIEKVVEFDLKFWEQKRNAKSRVCIWLETDNGDNYFVILDVRKKYVLIWTAFLADYQNQIEKKQKEYEVWRSSIGGAIMSPDELIADIQKRLP